MKTAANKIALAKETNKLLTLQKTTKQPKQASFTFSSIVLNSHSSLSLEAMGSATIDSLKRATQTNPKGTNNVS